MSKFLSGLRGKLFIVTLLPVFMAILTTSITFHQIGKVHSIFDEVEGDILPTVQSLSDIRKTRFAARQNILDAILHHQDENYRKSHIETTRQEIESLKVALKKYQATPMNDYESKEFPAVKEMLDSYYADWKKVTDYVDEGSDNSIAQSMSLLDGEMLNMGLHLANYAEKVTDLYDQQAKVARQETDALSASLKQVLIWTTLISSALLFIGMFFMSESMARHVGLISEKLSVTGHQVRESIEQLSQAGLTLSQSSTSAAASLEETVASLEEMSSMVKMNSENAKQAAELSQSSYQSAEKGEREIKLLIDSMREISQSSKKIEEIINVIDDIAFQTNLLALNAAVEAARAGEQGKGFAVVAEAVRALAQRSASAAKDINLLIQDSVHKIEGGTQVADKSGAVLNEIVTSVRKVSDLNNEIAAASSEQASGINQINKAMNDLDQSSQSNAASAEEIAATSGEIKSQAEIVESEVFQLNKFVAGSSKAAA